LLRYPRNTETVTTNAKTLNVQEALTKIQRPLDSTRVTVDVQGVFALPEAWKNAIAANDPQEAQYVYELEVCGVKMTGAHGVQKELTEEEKTAQAAAAPAKGKAPPPKGKVDDKPPTAEEQAALESQRAAKEEQERIKLAEWDKLSEEERFYRSSEDLQKNPRLAIDNKIAVAKFKAA